MFDPREGRCPVLFQLSPEEPSHRAAQGGGQEKGGRGVLQVPLFVDWASAQRERGLGGKSGCRGAEEQGAGGCAGAKRNLLKSGGLSECLHLGSKCLESPDW